MLFGQPFFLFVLLPAAVLLFYIAGSYVGKTAALAVIVASSAIFYAPYGELPVALLFTSLCANLALGSILCKEGEEHQWRWNLLIAGLVLNFAALATFKYLDQIAAMVAPSAGPILGIAIPAGISFYTFHQAVFLLDAYKRQPDVVNYLRGSQREKIGIVSALIRYAAFVAFFPQLVIGPITYMSEFGPQALRRNFGHLRRADIQVGLILIIVGLFKKLWIADGLANTVNPIFNAVAYGSGIEPLQAIRGILAFFFQLYFDFSGYSDIALGIARLFGIRLPINFDSPLRATGIMDFYRRWHMTLTRVISVFVFTSLSIKGTRFAIANKYRGWQLRALGTWLPLLINFQIIALWHAASYTFVLFGLIHGFWYVIETEVKASKAFRTFRSRTSDRLRISAGMAITVVPLMITFALFRSESLTAFWTLLSSAAGRLTPEEIFIDRREWYRLIAAAAIAFLLPNIYEVLEVYRPGIRTYENPSMTPHAFRVRWRPNVIWTLFIGLLAIAVYLRINIPAPFLYAGF